jgi:hypothetical protein
VLLQDVPLEIASELAEQVPKVFSVKSASKKSKCRLSVNSLRKHEFYEAKVFPRKTHALTASATSPPKPFMACSLA